MNPLTKRSLLAAFGIGMVAPAAVASRKVGAAAAKAEPASGVGGLTSVIGAATNNLPTVICRTVGDVAQSCQISKLSSD